MKAFLRCALFPTVAVLGATFAISGCRLFGEPQILAPLSFQQQMAEIYRIAPKGTPREEAVRRLNKAGITGEYAPHVDRRYEYEPSVYYCQLKDEGGGSQRQMTVAVLFNEQHELYAVTLSDMTDMPADVTEPAAGRPDINTPGSTSTNGFPTRSTIPLPQSSEATTPVIDNSHPRLGTRTPFANDNSR